MEAGREIDVSLPRGGRNWLALNAPAGQAEPPRTAGWQPRPHRDEPPPAQLASAEEPIREPVRREPKPVARKAETPREEPKAKAEPAQYQAPIDPPSTAGSDSDDEAERPPATPARAARPVWSPYRK